MPPAADQKTPRGCGGALRDETGESACTLTSTLTLVSRGIPLAGATHFVTPLPEHT